MITTIIKSYEFDTVIGMLDFERKQPQKVRINVSYTCDGFIDYVLMINFIEKFYNEQKFLSVEDSVKQTAQALKFEFKNLRSISLEISKLEIIKNAIVGAKIELVY